MRKLVASVLISWPCGACTSLLVNSGLPNPDYSVVETQTKSGNPVLTPDSLVQSTTRDVGQNVVTFSTVRPSILSTGTTNASWTHVQGVYLPAEIVNRWVDQAPSRRRWHVSQNFARALRLCAPDLGAFPSLPVAAVASALRFGRVTVGTAGTARTYYQFVTSRAQWRTELDAGPDGGGNNFRIVPLHFEIFGTALPVSRGRRAGITVRVEYRFSPGPTATYRFVSGPVDLRQVEASCAEGGALQVRGVTVQAQPTGWMPVAQASYNLGVAVTEESR
jgi:hypothetical protein